MGARIVTKPLTKLTSTLVPPNHYTSDAYPHLGPSVEGQPMPYGLGRAVLKAQLVDTTIGLGKYSWGDASLMTTKQLHGIVAIKRDDGELTRTPITDYTLDLTQNTVVINGSVDNIVPEDFEVEVDVTGKPDGGGAAINTFGPVVAQLLHDLIGVPMADIDISGTVGETKELAVWLGVDGQQRSLDSVLNSTEADQPSVARSVNGRVQVNTDGRWLVRKFDPTFDVVTGITLTRPELVRFDAVPDDSSTYWKAVAYYNRNFSTENFPYQQATSRKTFYEYESADVLQIYTYLRLATDAADVAAETLAIAGGPRTVYELEERTNKLFLARSSDIVRITTTPGLHPTGAFTDEDFWIERLQKTLTPEPRVAARVRRVATAVDVDPVAIIPLLHWSGPTTGVQDMRANPTLPFTTPGTYTITVDANMTLLFRGVAGGGSGGSGVATTSGRGGGGGGGGAKNATGDAVVLQQGSTYTLIVGAGGTGGAGANQDGAPGGDTSIGVQGGTKYVHLEGGRHGRHAQTGIGGAGGRALAGTNSVAGGAGGPGTAPPASNGSGSSTPGGGGGGGAAGDDLALTISSAGGTGGNGAAAGEAGETGDPGDGITPADGWNGGRGSSGLGVAVTGVTGTFGGGGGGGGESHGNATNDASNRCVGRNSQAGVAVLSFVSVP